LSEARGLDPNGHLKYWKIESKVSFKSLLENYVDPELLVEKEIMQYIFYTLSDLPRR
jgi:hypothetical protein